MALTTQNVSWQTVHGVTKWVVTEIVQIAEDAYGGKVPIVHLRFNA
jgi:hypothetical protein